MLYISYSCHPRSSGSLCFVCLCGVLADAFLILQVRVWTTSPLKKRPEVLTEPKALDTCAKLVGWEKQLVDMKARGKRLAL